MGGRAAAVSIQPAVVLGMEALSAATIRRRIGREVQIHPKVRIEIPWNLDVGDWSAIGFDALIYNLGPVRLGQRVTVSQRSHLCAGTHDFRDPAMPLQKPPITVHDDAWICADAFIGPGVEVRCGAVVGAAQWSSRMSPIGRLWPAIRHTRLVPGLSWKPPARNDTQMLKAPVSVILPVKNEAVNLPSCLDHLVWADEVFVVDSHSTDGTIEIAEKRGAKVVQFDFNGVYPKKKNWAIENLPFKNPWVLIVDADEHIPEELASEITAAIDRPEIDGYFLNRQFFFLGKWIKHCGYYPSWNLRLFRRERGRYERIEAPGADCGDNEVHEHVILDGHSRSTFENDMLHYRLSVHSKLGGET